MDYTDNVRRYCDDDVEGEWERLKRHKTEFFINSHYLDRYIRRQDVLPLMESFPLATLHLIPISD